MWGLSCPTRQIQVPKMSDAIVCLTPSQLPVWASANALPAAQFPAPKPTKKTTHLTLHHQPRPCKPPLPSPLGPLHQTPLQFSSTTPQSSVNYSNDTRLSHPFLPASSALPSHRPISLPPQPLAVSLGNLDQNTSPEARRNSQNRGHDRSGYAMEPRR